MSGGGGRAGAPPAGGDGAGPVGDDESRLAAVISPLRRTLLAAARERAGLPEIPDAQIEVVRALLPSTGAAGPTGSTGSTGSAERGPAELAEALHLSRSTVSNLLRAMEADGLVERRRAAGDGRRIIVVASARAIDLFHRFDQAAGDLLREALQALDPADREAVAGAVPALERLAAALRDTELGEAER